METRTPANQMNIDSANQILKEIAKVYATELINQSKKLGSKIGDKVSDVIQETRSIDDVMERFREYVTCYEPEKMRTITVTYNPLGDVEDIDYVKVTVDPEDDDLGGQDNIALLLAAAKILARTCPGIDEDAYGGMLLEATEDWMKSVVLDALLGGTLDVRS